jgi:hypothetical protein
MASAGTLSGGQVVEHPPVHAILPFVSVVKW